MPRVSKKLNIENFQCLKFLNGWLVSKNICTPKLQIQNFVETKISQLTITNIASVKY